MIDIILIENGHDGMERMISVCLYVATIRVISDSERYLSDTHFTRTIKVFMCRYVLYNYVFRICFNRIHKLPMSAIDF